MSRALHQDSFAQLSIQEVRLQIAVHLSDPHQDGLALAGPSEHTAAHSLPLRRKQHHLGRGTCASPAN